jgi:hypothetical protein
LPLLNVTAPRYLAALPEISGGLPVRDPQFSPDHEVFIGGILAQPGAVQGAVPAIFT